MLKDKRLIHGSRKVESLYLRRYFQDVLGESYVACCSREEAQDVYLGRPLDWLTGDYLPTAGALPGVRREPDGGSGSGFL